MKSEARFAFFDVDDTLIQIKSMFDFYRFWCLEIMEQPRMHLEFETDFSRMLSEGYKRESLNYAYYRYFNGIDPESLYRAGAAWAKKHLIHPEFFFFTPVVKELMRLQKKGITPVLISGSFHAVLDPIASELNVPHVLATELEIGEDGLYTGNIIHPQTIGQGKAVAVQAFLNNHFVSPRRCYAFGDDLSDLPLLRAVGYPVTVGNGTALTEYAVGANWPVIKTS